MTDRPTSPFRSGRSTRDVGLSGLTVLIVAALLAGAGLAVAGLVARGGGDDVVLEADDVVADVTPSTVPPLNDATSGAGDSASGDGVP